MTEQEKKTKIIEDFLLAMKDKKKTKYCRMCETYSEWTDGAKGYNQCCRECRNKYLNLVSANIQQFYIENPAYGKKPTMSLFRKHPWKVAEKYLVDLKEFGSTNEHIQSVIDSIYDLYHYSIKNITKNKFAINW